jgi:hypothetical protein
MRLYALVEGGDLEAMRRLSERRLGVALNDCLFAETDWRELLNVAADC